MRGMQVDLANTLIESLHGHLLVTHPKYRDDPSINFGFIPAELSFRIPEGSEWSSRIVVPAVIVSERQTRGIQIVGIDPKNESKSFLSKATIEGGHLAGDDDRMMIIGRSLAEDLRTEVGRRVVIIAQGMDGTSQETGFRVKGIYDTASGSTEETYIFTGLRTVQSFLGTNNVTEASLRLTGIAGVAPLHEALSQQFPDLVVLTWDQVSPHIAVMYRFVDFGIYIWLGIAFLALSFGIVNTLIMSVMERTRELGMLRAIGMMPRWVVVQIMFESLMVMAIGVTFGLGIGWLICWVFQDGIDLGMFAEGVAIYGMRPVLVPVVVGRDIGIVLVASISLALVASYFPVRRAVQVDPLVAMRV